jgi:uncharacterized protein YlxP (DUF503 family)
MIVGTCRIELHLDGNDSLKGKRAALKPLLARLHREFNVSAAEVDRQDSWQESIIALACVANEPAHVEHVWTTAVKWIDHNRPDWRLVDWQIEII